MKRQAGNNFLLLAFCHLLLFAYPLASKSFHTHKFQQEHCCDGHIVQGPEVGNQIEDCPICNYELLSFFSETSFSPSVYRFSYPLVVAPLPERVHTERILHFSLRGPPSA